MELSETILYNIIETNKKFNLFKNVREIAAYFLGIFSSYSKSVKYDEKGETHWIADFESFATNFLNQELNNFEDEWETTIETSYANWIYENQNNDEDGLNKFYFILEKYIRNIEALC